MPKTAKRQNLVPIESRPYQALLSVAAEDGQNTAELRNLLWLINAHPRLLSFRVIARNLDSVLTLIPPHLNTTLESLGLSEWPELTGWVMANKEKLTERLGDEFNQFPSRPGKNPLVGQGATRHPLYVGLWSIHEIPEYRTLYQLCVAHALIAHARLMRTHTTQEQYEHFCHDKPLLKPPYDPAPVGIALRTLSEAEALPHLQRLGPNRSPDKFARQPYRSVVSEVTEIADVDDIAQRHAQYLNSYVYFVQKAHGYREWQSRKRAGSAGGGGEHVHGYVDESLLNDAQVLATAGQSEGSARVCYDPPRAAEVEELLLNDVDPHEAGDQGETYLIDNPPGHYQRSMIANRLSAKNQAKHLAMSSQFWPWQYEVLTCEEIHLVMAAISGRMEELMATAYVRDKHRGRENELDSLVLALISFWTGSPLSRALELRTYPKRNEIVRNHNFALLLPRDEGRASWQIHSQFPDYRSKLGDAPRGVVRKRATHVFLPDVAGLAAVLGKLAERREKKLTNRSLPFGVSEKEVRKQFNNLVNGVAGCEQVTITRWERTLFRAVTTETADVTDAVALTGTRNAVASTKSFYTTPRLQDLADLYCQVMHRLYRQCQLTDLFPNARFEPLVFESDTSVGSRACARKEAVIDAVSDLTKQLRRDRRYQTWQAFREYHNRYTFYTVQLLNFATGYRAVCTPYIDRQDRDEARQIAMISDKDGATRNRRRIAYLPQVVIRQLAHYEEHVAQLRAVAGHQLITDKSADWPACFLIDKRHSGAVLPKTLRPWLQDFLGLPANAHRRFLRTELKEAGCPAEILNAFMGHASQGEEAWGRYSSISVDLYCKQLAYYLEPLLEELGFEPVKSRLVGGIAQS